MRKIFVRLSLVLLVFSGFIFNAYSQTESSVLETMHSISSHTLYGYVKELCKEKYGGRLTGTKGFNLAAEWVISHFKK